jgi:transcriptional regulator with PAS, ATPase and Fis domain
MSKNTWFKTFPGALMVTDKDGKIINMNDPSAENYKKDGGYDLLGTNAIMCHQGPSLKKIEELYQSHEINTYTISKDGKKKLIYQAPYFENGEFAGMVELSLPLPDMMPHYDRDATKK